MFADDQRVQRLSFHARHLDPVKDGSKRVTMRFEDPVTLGPALLVFEFPEQIAIPGRVLATVAKKVADVSDEEARADGFSGREQVLPALREYYPGLQATDEIVIVSFDVDESSEFVPDGPDAGPDAGPNNGR